jgi:hypothetical protein
MMRLKTHGNNACSAAFVLAAAVSLLLLSTIDVFAWGWAARDSGRQSSENPSIYLGDSIEFHWDVDAAGWGGHVKKAGAGATDASGSLNWQDIAWVDEAGDGAGDNEGVKSASFQGTSVGTWYYSLWIGWNPNGGVGDSNGTYHNGSGTWHDGDSAGFISSSFTVAALTNVTIVSISTNTTSSDSQIKVSWTPWESKDVMVVRGTNATFYTPTNGTAYSAGFTTNDEKVVFNAAGTSCVDTGLTVGIKYYYRLFSVNNDYYASGVDTNYTITLPEMAVTGNGYEISDGNTSPVASNHTDFGDALLDGGTVVRTFTVQNSGNVTLDLTGSPAVAISGTHAGDFSLSSVPGTTNIAAGGSTTFAITFDPSATNTRIASLSIANNDVTENPYTFSIQGAGVEPEIGLLGNGQSITNGDISPVVADGTYFGSLAITHDSVTHTFVITNSGTGGLSLTNATRVAISGHQSDFTVQSQPASAVAAGGSRAFTIRFSPTAYGARTGTVSIASTDADEDPYVFRIQGSAYKAAFVDDFGVGKSAPLCIDLDGDNVSDAWETAYFGNTSSNSTGDADGDGWSNREEFLAGTNPTNSGSYFRVVLGGLEDDTSTNIQLSLVGGDYSGPTNFIEVGDAVGRVYRIYAADGSVANTKTLLATVSEGLTGTNVWTDTGATELVSRRYYEVEVAYAGGAYTNTEEWALYVEPRTTNRSYLVCVPVDYGSDAANNLNSTLGEQLATGLNSSDTESAADKLRFVNAAGSWVEYYLSEAYGWTTNGTASANVMIKPGQALWVVRGSNAAVRENTVFVGRSFVEGDMEDTTFKTTGGGWTAFGWPLPNTRQAVSSVASANQLGFSSKGTGGTTWQTNSVNHGDQLWVPDGDGGWDWYWLLTTDRWYKGDGNVYGDITLSPGVSYYYYHTTNSGGANFNWKPEIP